MPHFSNPTLAVLAGAGWRSGVQAPGARCRFGCGQIVVQHAAFLQPASWRGPPCRGVSHSVIEELVDSPASPFYSLGLAEHQKAGGYERAMRRQVNQLRRLKADPTALALGAPPDWGALFANPNLPLVVDLGCGAGRCMLAAAAAAQEAAAQRRQDGSRAAGGQTAAAEAAQEAAELSSRLEECGRRSEDEGLVAAAGAAATAGWYSRAPMVTRVEERAGEVEAGAAMEPTGRPGAEGAADEDCRPAGRSYGSRSAGRACGGAQGGGGGGGGGSGGGANFLGVDVRLALTSRANAWARMNGLQHRVAFLCANANASLSQLLDSYGTACRTTQPVTSAGGDSHRSTPPPAPDATACDGFGSGSTDSGPCTDNTDNAAGSLYDRTPHRSTNRASSSRCLLSGPSNKGGDHDGAVGSQGAAAHVAGGGGSSSGSEREAGGRGSGSRVALVCLQFSDPPVRRQALVGGDDLVAQLATALGPGALVWIQSDVLSIAESLRGLFWQHGGFAPSVRHAAATSAVRTRHWLRTEPEQPAPLLAPPEPSAVPQPRTVPAGAYGSIPIAAAAMPARTAAFAATCGRTDANVAALTSASEAQSAAVARAAAEHAACLPLLLVQADLAAHREPWLSDSQVAAVVEQHRHRLHRRSAQATGLEGCWQGKGSEGKGPEPPGFPEDAGPGLSDGAGIEGGAEGCDGWGGLPWLDSNPLGVPTEREVYVERGGRPIYRLLLVRR